MKRFLIEGKNYNGVDTHFAINKQSNLIVFAWDYSDYDPSDLRQFKNDYFFSDLKDMEFNPKEYKILTLKGCVKQGIDPNNDASWSNDGVTPCAKSISESMLKIMVKDAVKNVLKEDAGHLYWKDENGKSHTNSRETWRGVEGTIFVYHGDWSDPEVLYNDKDINYWDLENNAWEAYKYECEGDEKEPSEQEFDNLPSSWFKDYLDNEYMPCAFGEGL